MKLVVGITGSTGVIYGIRLLETLKRLNIETHLIMSEWAEKCIVMETDHDLNYVKWSKPSRYRRKMVVKYSS